MKLSINNFAKIKNADIIVDGITVIAGENNTGKSTVGKVIFALFNSLADIDDKISRQREKEISDSLRSYLIDYLKNYTKISSYKYIDLTARNVIENIWSQLKNESLAPESISKIIEDAVASEIDHVKIHDDISTDTLKPMTLRIIELLLIPKQVICTELLSRYFKGVFNSQMNSLVCPAEDAKLQLCIKNKNITLAFVNNECEKYDADIKLLNKAIYIDNPFIVDKLSGKASSDIMDEFLLSLLKKPNHDNLMDGIIESVIAKEKMKDIYQAMQSIINGQITMKPGGEFFLENKDFKQPISLGNLSTGLKAFVILKMLIEKGAIKDRDILILDEPEIHLHPQWQVTYAELIVLLQKYFNLSVIVTTHSPYFLDAIHLFSIKHGIEPNVNYYLSENSDKGVQMNLVTDNIDMIYKEMASPIQMLDSLRYELNNN